jgi:hypothetical protein
MCGGKKNKKHRVGLNIPVKLDSSSILVKISCYVLIRKIGMIKNRLILTGIFIEMGVIEIEYELNKINVFNKIDEEPNITGICRLWEQLNNPNSKGVEFDTFRKQTILNNFNLTAQKYKTIFSK